MCRAFPAPVDKSSVLFKGTSGIGKYRLHLSSHITNPAAITTAQKDGTKMPMMVKGMSAKLQQQTQLRMEVLSNMHSMLQAKDLPSRCFQACLSCRRRMVWTLVYNIIVTKSAKSLFQS